MDGIGDRLAEVSAAIRGLTADVSALDGRTTAAAGVDALSTGADTSNMRIAGLASKTDAANSHMAGLSAGADALRGLPAKADAVSVLVAGLSAGADAVSESATGMSAKTDGASAKADALDMRVDAVMAAVNQSLETAKGMSGTCCSKVDRIADELLPKLQADADGIADAVTDDRRGAEPILRMNSLEESVDKRAAAIESALGGISERLDAVRDRVASVPVPLPGVETVTVEAAVDPFHYARTVSKAPADNIYRYNFDFACKSEVFVHKVEVDVLPIANMTGNTALAGSGTTPSTYAPGGGGGGITCPAKDCLCGRIALPGRPTRTVDDHTDPDCPNYSGPAQCRQLPGKYDANPFGPDVLRYGNLTQKSTITVHGMPLLDTRFDPNPNDPNNMPVRLHQPAAFELFELSPGAKLRTKTVMNATSLATNAKVFDGVPHNNYSFFDHGALAGVSGTLSNAIKLDLYRIKATVLAVGEHGCQFGVGGSDVYGRERSILLSVIGEGNLVKSFRTALDCNDKPARIMAPSKVQFNFGGTVGPDFAGLGALKLEAGGRAMEFAFNAAAQPVHKPGTATSLEWDGGDLAITGAIPIVQGALIKVAYETVPGNACTEAN